MTQTFSKFILILSLACSLINGSSLLDSMLFKETQIEDILSSINNKLVLQEILYGLTDDHSDSVTKCLDDKASTVIIGHFYKITHQLASGSFLTIPETIKGLFDQLHPSVLECVENDPQFQAFLEQYKLSDSTDSSFLAKMVVYILNNNFQSLRERASKIKETFHQEKFEEVGVEVRELLETIMNIEEETLALNLIQMLNIQEDLLPTLQTGATFNDILESETFSREEESAFLESLTKKKDLENLREFFIGVYNTSQLSTEKVGMLIENCFQEETAKRTLDFVSTVVFQIMIQDLPSIQAAFEDFKSSLPHYVQDCVTNNPEIIDIIQKSGMNGKSLDDFYVLIEEFMMTDSEKLANEADEILQKTQQAKYKSVGSTVAIILKEIFTEEF